MWRWYSVWCSYLRVYWFMHPKLHPKNDITKDFPWNLILLIICANCYITIDWWDLIVYDSSRERASLSAERFQKVFIKVFNLAFKKQIIVVKSRFYNDFSLYIALLSDGINPLLTIIFRSYSATHSKRKNYPTSVWSWKLTSMSIFPKCWETIHSLLHGRTKRWLPTVMPWHKASLIPKPIAWQGKRSPVSRAQFLPTRYPCFRLGMGVRAGTSVTSSRKTRADTEIESVTAKELVDKELKKQRREKRYLLWSLYTCRAHG